MSEYKRGLLGLGEGMRSTECHWIVLLVNVLANWLIVRSVKQQKRVKNSDLIILDQESKTKHYRESMKLLILN